MCNVKIMVDSEKFHCLEPPKCALAWNLIVTLNRTNVDRHPSRLLKKIHHMTTTRCTCCDTASTQVSLTEPRRASLVHENGVHSSTEPGHACNYAPHTTGMITGTHVCHLHMCECATQACTCSSSPDSNDPFQGRLKQQS